MLIQLLSFTLPPRTQPPAARRARRHDGYRPFNRERYVNAQYRFVMKPTYDCIAQIADADAPLPWQDIVQVILSNTSDLPGAKSDANCPICLSPPSAARMTKCGHVYCFACILHYLIVAEDEARPRGMLSHKQSKRCPICWDEVHPRDLRAVLWVDAHQAASEFTESYRRESGGTKGEPNTITLRLVERPHGTTFALPRSHTWPSAAREEGVYCFQPDALTFARVVLATPEFLIASLERDVAEIDAELINVRQYAPDELSVEFLHVAKQQLDEQIAKAQAQQAASELKRVEAAREALGRAQQWPTSVAAQEAIPPSKSDAYFFYQAASGQNIFIHPLDVKVLLAHFGTYANFPNTLQVAIQTVEEGTMDENLRRKCKYIAHLPMSSDITFIEVDWARTAALFGETQGKIDWKPYEGMLRQRLQRHRDKHNREERARARAEKVSTVASARAMDPHASDGIVPDDTLSFRESAMVGAEMFFPVHPGSDAEAFEQSGPLPSAPAPKPASTRKTVWGTPAAPSASGPTPDAHVVDDAWNALEQAHGSHEGAPTEQPSSNTKNQKRKPKLILTGGGRGMG